jgi:hypothetical protein
MAVVSTGPIPDLLSIVLSIWLLGLATMILFAIVSGKVILNGLFTTDIDNDGIADEFHIERVQLLLISLFGIAGYAFTALAAHTGSTPVTALPEIPDELLMLMGASNSLYLTGKFGRNLKRG